jgi:3-oxoacyl-(acyl-carrier-protein) synthase/aryl carrier-like protein
MHTDIAYNVELKNSIETYITEKIAQILNTNPSDLDKDENLLELGFESSSLVKFSEDFENEINIKLFPTVFFEHQTITEVSIYFSTEFSAEFETYLNKGTSISKEHEKVPVRSSVSGTHAETATAAKVQETDRFSEKNIPEKNQTHKIVWVNLGKESIIKTYELTNNFNAHVISLSGNNNNLVELAENATVIFYADQQVLEQVQPQMIFSMLRFLRYQIGAVKPKQVIFLLEDFQHISSEQAVAKIKNDFLLIPHENIAELPFRVESLEKFDIPHLSAVLTGVRNNKKIVQKYINETDIAIIGMDCKFPQSPDIEAYWDNIINERDLIQEVDTYRSNIWKSITAIQNEAMMKSQTFWGGFVEGVDQFDHEFFKISAREAEVMDPQQRLFLQSVWKCIEHAGYDPRSLSDSSTGVFGAVGTRDYHELSLMYHVSIEPQLSTGLAHSILSNRISYLLNLNGPSESIDTACSSSLVALHRAVKAIHNNECTQAIVGGVNLNLSPLVFMAFNKTGILSPQGRCRSFDKSANGYARGEGVGTVFVKPLRKAIEDGDYIHGVIKGTAVNHGGYGQSLTAPNPVRQAEVIAKAIEISACDPATIGYIEAHGTGTALGDTVEIEGLKKAFRKFNTNQQSTNDAWCAVGSVKSNIGHLETAAGIAGLLKVVQSFKYKKIPASIHIDVVNPLFSLKNSPFTIAQKSTDWKRITPDIPLRAGVSSFGFGGTNAHIILEEYENKSASSASRQKYFFPFSAPSEAQLHAYLKLFMDQPSYRSLGLENIAFTLQNGRTVYKERCAFEAETYEELIGEISNFINRKSDRQITDTVVKKWIAREIDELKNVNLRAGRVPICSFPFNESSHWLGFGENFDLNNNTKNSTQVIAQPVTPAIEFQIKTHAEQTVEELLIQQVSAILKRNPESIDKDVSLIEYGLDSILGMSLVKQLEQVFKAPIYINELLMHDTIRKLATYLEEEFLSTTNTALLTTENTPFTTTDKNISKSNIPIVFVLSAPRSGSTLLRSMLMSNTKLFAPPEPHLLNFNTLQERKKHLGQTPLYEGLLETITSLMHISVDEAKEYLKGEEEKNTSSIDFYKYLQHVAGDRIFVDKSPSYAERLETLFKAEDSFEQAKYIFLIRHPFAVMESVIRNRFHRLMPVSDSNLSPMEIAERIWLNFNDNIQTFIKELPAEKYHLVFYEDLVNDPYNTTKKICSFLNIEFEEGMLNPYNEENLINGLTKNSLSVGDPNFLKHNSLESDLAYAWMKDFERFPELSASGKKLSAAVGYDIAEPLAVTPIQQEYLKQPENMSWALAHHVRFDCDAAVTETVLQEAVNDLLRAFPQLHRKLNADKTYWEWEYNTDVLRLVEYLPHIPEGYFASVCETYRSAINSQTGQNCVLSVARSSETVYECVFLYNHLLGDGITSLQFITFLIDRLHGKSGYRVPVIKSGSSSKLLTGKISAPVLPINNTTSFYPVGNRKEIKSKHVLEEVDIDYMSIFSLLGESLVDTIKKRIDVNVQELAIRFHNRNNSALTIAENLQETGLYALDVPVNIIQQGNFADAFHQAVKTGADNSLVILSGGTYRFNFQPVLSNKNNYILIDSTELWAENTAPAYALDCIARVFENKLDLIIRYNDSIYADEFSKEFVAAWLHEFLTVLHK